MAKRLWLGLALLLAVLGACGGDESNESGSGTSRATTTVPGAGAGAGAAAATPEVPAFMRDFARVCTTQVGFPGTAAYEQAPGVHPMVLFEEHRGESFVQSSSSGLPEGWTVKEDMNFQDNSELKTAQLIACSDRVKEAPTGKICDFDDDGQTTKLELVNATYQLKVYEARTGQLKHEETLEAVETECPFIATYKKGDTTYVAEPSDDQYINALKGVVAP